MTESEGLVPLFEVAMHSHAAAEAGLSAFVYFSEHWADEDAIDKALEIILQAV